MTGVRGVMAGTGRGPGVGAEGGGRDPGAGAGGGQLQGLGAEAEGPGAGAEGEERQEATAESVIPGAETPSRVVIRDPSLGAGVELRGLLTAFYPKLPTLHFLDCDPQCPKNLSSSQKQKTEFCEI